MIGITNCVQKLNWGYMLTDILNNVKIPIFLPLVDPIKKMLINLLPCLFHNDFLSNVII